MNHPNPNKIRHVFTRCVTDLDVVGQARSQPNYGLNTPAPSKIVLADRHQLAAEVGMPIVWMEQTHSDVVAVVDPSYAADTNGVQADATVTRHRLGLAVQVADCVPVLLWDEHLGIIAAAHAGRAGVLNQIVQKTVDQMVTMGCVRSDIKASVGPCVCASCYEVSPDLYDTVVAARPELGHRTPMGQPSLDIRTGVLADLVHSGVANPIQDLACTRESSDLNSYRRNPACGRQIGLITRL